MSFFGAIRWTALRALQPNNGLLRHSNQLQTNGSIRLLNMFGKMSQDLENQIPKRPKRPQSGYNIFYKDLSAQIRTEDPTIKVKELAKTIGNRWQELDPMVKEDLINKTTKSKEKYKEEIEKWKKSLSEKQKENYLLGLRSRKRVLARRRLKSELKVLKYPLRPKNAFNLFMKETISCRPKTGEPSSQVFKDVASKWKTLSDQQKEPYVKSAQNDKIRFLSEMKDWKEDIAKQENKETLDKLNKLRSLSSRSSLIPEKKVKKKAKKISKTVKSKTKAKSKSKSKTTKAKAKTAKAKTGKSKPKTTEKSKRKAKPKTKTTKTPSKEKKTTKGISESLETSSDESDKDLK